MHFGCDSITADPFLPCMAMWILPQDWEFWKVDSCAIMKEFSEDLLHISYLPGAPISFGCLSCWQLCSLRACLQNLIWSHSPKISPEVCPHTEIIQSDLETTLKTWASLAFNTQLYSEQGTAAHLQQNMYFHTYACHMCFCKVTYPSKLIFQVANAVLMQDAKKTGFGIVFPFAWLPTGQSRLPPTALPALLSSSLEDLILKL